MAIVHHIVVLALKTKSHMWKGTNCFGFSHILLICSSYKGLLGEVSDESFYKLKFTALHAVCSRKRWQQKEEHFILLSVGDGW